MTGFGGVEVGGHRPFFVLCGSNSPIPGIQKHLCWPVGYSGMAQTCFGVLCSSNSLIIGIKKHLCRPGVHMYGCLGRHPKTPRHSNTLQASRTSDVCDTRVQMGRLPQAMYRALRNGASTDRSEHGLDHLKQSISSPLHFHLGPEMPQT